MCLYHVATKRMARKPSYLLLRYETAIIFVVARWLNIRLLDNHYSDIIMDTMASQITSLAIVYSTGYSGADQRKHQSSAWLAGERWIPRTKGQLCYLITSSWFTLLYIVDFVTGRWAVSHIMHILKECSIGHHTSGYAKQGHISQT